MRRHGYQLFRVLPVHEGETLVAELRRQGLSLESIRARGRGGSPSSGCARRRLGRGTLVLADGDTLSVSCEDLLIACHGRIHREREARLFTANPRGRSTAVLEEEHRIHLHRRDNPRPLEIDPGAFEFADAGAVPLSSLLRLARS